jgi:hypothetical protein
MLQCVEEDTDPTNMARMARRLADSLVSNDYFNGKPSSS